MKITCVADLGSLPKPYQLAGADLENANLEGASLAKANLAKANLAKANLAEANLAEASLRGANLWGAILEGAHLDGASLAGASLAEASLAGASLAEASLAKANLRGANLRGANLWEANLWEAILEGAKLPDPFVKLPPVGESFIAWKKVHGGIVLKLEIPAESPRVSTFTGVKCRAKSAKVLQAFDVQRNPTTKTEFESMYEPTFIYRLGEVVEVKDFDDDIRVEYARGIHFFFTREEAEEYGR